MDGKDALAPLHIGTGHDNSTVKAAWPQQRRIEYIRTVGGCDENDTFVGFEAVHLDQQLIQCLFALVMTATEAGATMTSHGIDLIDKDDARRILLSLFEKIADTRSANANEHLDEVRAADGKERDIRLAGNRACQQRFSGAGRANKKDAFGDAAAQFLKLLGFLQEVDNLLQFFFGLVDARDIFKRNLLLMCRQQACAALDEGKRLVSSALHLAHEEDPEAEDEQHRQTPGQQHSEPGVCIRRIDLYFDLVCNQLCVNVRIIRGNDRSERLFVGVTKLAL